MIKNKDGTYSSYGIYDGRFHSDPDRAVLFEECDTLQEARTNRKDYGEGNVIVRITLIEYPNQANSYQVIRQTFIE